MANEGMSLSDQGYGELRLSEGVRMEYCNDQANHCTFGVGTLVHHGPCTAEEMQQTVTPEMANTALAQRVHVTAFRMSSSAKSSSTL